MTLFFNKLVVAQASLNGEVVNSVTDEVVLGSLDLGNLEKRDGLYLFPYYIRFQYSSQNFTAWGIQIYTNNRPSDNSWTAADGLYNGLRGVTDPQVKLPLYWQVYSTPPDISGTWGTAQSVTTTVGGLGFYNDSANGFTLRYWGLVKDRSDFDVVNNWNDATLLDARTIVNYEKMGNFPSTGRSANGPPVYLYLGMDLRPVSQDQSFQTSLVVDLYNLNIDLEQGGYVTPNPFTPTTGQKANFNFFMENFDSSFKISIYTIRGRLIRTITTTKEWDGRNDQGHMVEGGLYVYQIEAEGKRVSGTVVLIK